MIKKLLILLLILNSCILVAKPKLFEFPTQKKNIFKPSLDALNDGENYVGFDYSQMNSGYKNECLRNIAQTHTGKKGRNVCDPYAILEIDSPTASTSSSGPSYHIINVKKNNQIFNTYIGRRLSDYHGIEIGGLITNQLNGSKMSKEGYSKIKGIHLSLILIVPLTSSIELLPSLGLSYLRVHFTSPTDSDIHKLGEIIPRFMLAPQVRLTDKFKLRGSVVYYATSDIMHHKFSMYDTVHFGIGLNYGF